MKKLIIKGCLIIALFVIVPMFSTSVYAANIAEGTYDNVPWKITNQYELQIGTAGEQTKFRYESFRGNGDYPWISYPYRKVRFLGTVIGNGSHRGMFWGQNLERFNASGFETSNVTDMSEMFGCCQSDDGWTLDLSSWDTSNVTDMSRMFDHCSDLWKLNVSGFDTSKVENMSEMFYGCQGLTALDVHGFDTSNVKDMSSMFRLCDSIKTLDLVNWYTRNVTDMSNMFRNCVSLKEIDMFQFETANAVTESAFAGCKSLIRVYLGPEAIFDSDAPQKTWKRTMDYDGDDTNWPTITNLSYYDGTYPGCYETKISPKVKLRKAYTYRVRGGKTQVVLKVKYSKKEVTSFEIKIAKNKKCTKGVKRGRADKAMLKKGKIGLYGKLKKGKKYYVRVRAVRDIGENTFYGPWSTVKKIKGR